jgi:hypothetical protein
MSLCGCNTVDQFHCVMIQDMLLSKPVRPCSHNLLLPLWFTNSTYHLASCFPVANHLVSVGTVCTLLSHLVEVYVVMHMRVQSVASWPSLCGPAL